MTCWPVITETAWLLRTRPDTLIKVFGGFDGGFFALLPVDADDLPAIAALMKRYESLACNSPTLPFPPRRAGKIPTVFTLDRRDFSILRLRRNRVLKIIPEVQ